MAMVLNPETGQYEDEAEYNARLAARGTFNRATLPPMGDEEAARAAARTTFAQTALPNKQARALTEINPSTFEPPAKPQDIIPPPPIAPEVAKPPSKRVEGGSSTRTRTIISPEEEQAQKRIGAADEKMVGVAKKQGDVAVKQAEADVVAAEREATNEKTNQLQQQELDSRWSKKIQADQDHIDKAVQDRAAMKIEEFGAGDPTWVKVARAIAIGLGEVGRALTKSGHNSALEIVRDQTQEHYMLERAKLEEGDRKIAEARQGRADTMSLKMDERATLERNQIALNKALAASIRAEGARIGTEHARAEAERIAVSQEQEAANHAQQLAAVRRQQVSSETKWQNTEGAGAAGAAKATSTDLEEVGKLTTDIGNLDRVAAIIQKNPKAWEEYRKNQESWQRAEALGSGGLGKTLRQAEQATGIGPHSAVSPEQGLKSADAKFIHQAMQKVETGIAKGYGGAITGSDKDNARSELTALASDPQQALGTIGRLRGTMMTKRDLYTQNRAMVAPPIQAAPSGPPPGAVMGTMNGRRGYVLNGKFVPLE